MNDFLMGFFLEYMITIGAFCYLTYLTLLMGLESL